MNYVQSNALTILHGEGVAVVWVQINPKLFAELVPMPVAHPSGTQPGYHR